MENNSLEKLNKISELKKLIENSNDLEVGTEDIFLTKFLNFTLWDVEKAMASIRRYYDFKFENPKWMANHSVEYFRKQIIEMNSKFLLPLPDKYGRPILVFKAVDFFHKYENYFYDLNEIDDLIMESLLILPNVQERGANVIMDITGLTKNFLQMLSPSNARKMNTKAKILPCIHYYIHIIQNGSLLTSALDFVLPILSKDMKEHLHIHKNKDFNKLRDMLGYESLPSEYGGPPSNNLDMNILLNHLQQHAEYLLKLQSYRKKSN